MNKKLICFDSYGNKYLFLPKQFINREAVYGINISSKKILLVQDSKSKKWEIPGGGKINAETDFEALKREFFEETGFVIDKPVILFTTFISYFFDIESKEPWKAYRKFYIVKEKNGRLNKNGNNNDIQKAQYVSFDFLQALTMDENIRNVLIKLSIRG